MNPSELMYPLNVRFRRVIAAVRKYLLNTTYDGLVGRFVDDQEDRRRVFVIR